MIRKKLILTFVLFISVFVNVKAAQLEGTTIINYYVHANNQRSELKMFKDSASGNILFAMKPYEAISSSTLKSMYVENYSKLDNETKNDIQDILFLGYGYKEHSDVKWYIIAQYMLWDYLGYDFDIKNELGVSIEEEYAVEYREYLELINNFKIIPSYFLETIDVNYDDKFLLNDLNDVEDNFTLIPHAFLRIGKSGEEKFIYGTKPTQSKLVAVRKEQNNEYNKIFYSDAEEFINNVNVARRIFEVDVNVHGGKIKVLNMDEFNQPIKGTVYSLYNSNDKLIATFTTNAMGEAISEYITYDDYYLKEISIDSKYVPTKGKIEVNLIDYTVTELILKNSNLLDIETEEILDNENIITEDGSASNDIVVTDGETEQEIINQIIEPSNDTITGESQEIITKEDLVLVNVPNTKLDLTKYILIIGSSLFVLGIKLYVK